MTLLRDARQISRRILNARNVLQLEQSRHCLDRHVNNGAWRDVVDDDRDSDCIVHRLEVFVHTFLRRLVVIRRHHKQSICARGLGMLGEIDGFARRVRAGTRDHGDAALGFIHAPFSHLAMLVVAQRWALARRADGNQPVRPLRNLPAHKRAKSLLVEAAVFEWRDQGRE